MRLFSTITSPVFSELIVVIAGVYCSRLPYDVSLFQTLRRMNETTPFKLVFLLEGLNPLRSGTRQQLALTLQIATADGLLDFLDSPPTIRTARPHEFPLL